MTPKKKLIEVALPLPEINDASAYDKMPGIGPHPKGIHHWWARLPLPAARAVLFASVVDDPSSRPEEFPTEEIQDAERERLFQIIRGLMQKQLHKRPELYAEARSEMLKSCDGQLPTVLDPFAGGGSIPLEAARLGFTAHAADLNPVCVLLNKCNLELIPRWAGAAPVNSEDQKKIGGSGTWHGATGLAADVRYYSRVILDRARARMGHLYPPARVSAQMALHRQDLKPFVGKELPIVAWIWARTVRSPNPAVRGAYVPLMSTFWLSNKKGGEVWLEPIVDRTLDAWRFAVRAGPPRDRTAVRNGTKNGSGGFRCLLTDSPIPFDYVQSEGRRGEIRMELIAVVAKLPRNRIYLPATSDQCEAGEIADPHGFPDTDLPEEALGFRVQNYGIMKHWQVFTARQLTAMVTLSDLVKDASENVLHDARRAGLTGEAAKTYAGTVSTFLATALDRCSDFNNSLCGWNSSNQKVMHLFGRQAIPMIWDFAEANILGDSVGAWTTCSDYVADCIEVVTAGSARAGQARQANAASGADGHAQFLISTDPPYYDNVGYAALSDFFYIWLRRTIGDVYPDLFSTILVPKEQELVAAPELFAGDKRMATEHFEMGFRQSFAMLRERMDPSFPLTVYYAFKQDDEEDGSGDGKSSHSAILDRTTGWETMLEALIGTGFQVTATWPMRASQAWRMRAMASNALASYIVLACRPRAKDAPQTDRRLFVRELKRELPSALRHLQQGNIAPVDFAQAAIGPGMAVYSRYRRILEANGQPLGVRTALALINQTLTEVLSEQEDEFDSDTRWAITWFEQRGFAEGDFGEAELLSKAKVTSVGGLVQAGIVVSGSGKVRLLKPAELPTDWNPTKDSRLTTWEIVHHLIRLLEDPNTGSEAAAASQVVKLGSKAEIARELAYRLYSLCERKKRATEALSYNALVQSWPEITRLARETAGEQQGALL